MNRVSIKQATGRHVGRGEMRLANSHNELRADAPPGRRIAHHATSPAAWRPTATCLFALLAFATVCVFASKVRAAEDPDANDSPVAATVGGQPIHVAEVEQMIRSLTKKLSMPNPLSKEAYAQLAAEALDQLIRQRLVQKLLQRNGEWADGATVDAEIEKQKQRLAAQGRDLSEVLKQEGISQSGLRRDLAWQLAWKQYLAEHLSDAHLGDYFKKHRPQYDGSQIRASHILLRPAREGDSQELAALVRRANGIRKEVTDGKLSFAAAAKKYSEGPSGKDGGDLGFFPRHGLMVEPFSRAVFQLDDKEISLPVLTSFGVHLIQRTGIKPGDKQWTDVRDQLVPAASAQLFQDLAAAERKTTKIEYTGRSPFRQPGTRKIFIPKTP